jgi:hypothetical protein
MSNSPGISAISTAQPPSDAIEAAALLGCRSLRRGRRLESERKRKEPGRKSRSQRTKNPQPEDEKAAARGRKSRPRPGTATNCAAAEGKAERAGWLCGEWKAPD